MSEEFENATIEAFGRAELSRGSAAEIATRMLAALEKSTTQPLAYDFGKLWRYDPPAGVWCELDEPTIDRLVQRLDGWGVVNSTSKSLSVGMGVWKGVARALTSSPRERSGFFAKPAQGLAFTNGFAEVDVNGIRLVSHSADHRQRHAYPMPWDENADCPMWFQALDDWGLPREADQRFSAQAFGTGLLGLAPRAEKALVLLGPGKNGKSVYMGVLQGMFPAEWRSSVPMTRLGDRFGASQLFGKRLNSLADAPNDDFVDSAGFKAIVSGDEIQGEKKYKDGFAFRPEALLAYSFNPPRPTVADASDGFWRRIAVLEFNVKIDEAKKIEGLAEIILERERPGIMAWALHGAVDRLRNGWAPCGEESVAEWRHAEDTIGLWLETAGATFDGWSPAMELYTHFKRWAEPRSRMRGLTDRTFYEKLNQHLTQSVGDGERVKKKGASSNMYRVNLPLSLS